MTAWLRSLPYALARALPLSLVQSRGWHGRLETVRASWMKVPCGTENKYSNGCRCARCLSAHRALYRRKRAERRAAGLCGACGVRPAMPGRYRCTGCQEDHAAWELSRRRRMRGESRGKAGHHEDDSLALR